MATPTHIQPDESALLADFLSPSLTLLDLSEHHNLPLPDLLAWAESPATVDLLARLRKLAHTRATLLAADHAPAAVTTLSTASATALAASLEIADPTLRLRAIESARKAAGQVLRTAPQPRSGARQATDPQPTATATPSAVATPQEVAPDPQVGQTSRITEPPVPPETVSADDTPLHSPILDAFNIPNPSFDPEVRSRNRTEDLALALPGP